MKYACNYKSIKLPMRIQLLQILQNVIRVSRSVSLTTRDSLTRSDPILEYIDK